MDRNTIIPIIVLTVVILNVISFLLFGIDKIKAVNSRWRISEKALLKMSLIGPLGSYLAMKIFRHKINKPRFYIGIPFFGIVQIIVVIIFLLIYHFA